MVLIAGCANNKMPAAPVIERTPPPPVVAPPVVEETKPEEKRGAYYTVKRGDTLISIALQTGQDYREIAAWNNLESPYVIYVGQVLHVLPPDGAVALPVNPPATANNIPTANTPAFKIEPLGLKRPYTDAALAEMSKPDGAVVVASAGTNVGTNNAATATATAKPDTEDTGIVWAWPVTGKVTESYTPTRKGLDLTGKAGDPVYSAADGKVLVAGNGIRGYGNMVIIKHSNGYVSVYAHNSKLLVNEQQVVRKGQKIAEMGNSDVEGGDVKLHFEIRNEGKPVDPAKFLPGR